MTDWESAAREADTARSIIRLNTAYTHSKLLQSAVEVGVFPLLDGTRLTAGEIAARLSLHPRLTPDFLDALHGLGLLAREDGRYTDSPAASAYLVPGRPHYLGGTIAKHGAQHYAMWDRLAEALRDGEVKCRPELRGEDGFHRLYADPDRARGFLDHMDSINGFIAVAISRLLDWSAHASFVDVGGARGNLAAILAAAHPGLRGTVFDLPPLEPFFDELVGARGLAERVRFHGGDFFTGPIPAADVVIVGHTLHDWPVRDRVEVVGRAAEAVRPGGRLLVYDPMLADERTEVDKLVQSLMCALMREGASEYTVAEVRSWAERAGLRFEHAVPLPTLGNDVVTVFAKD
ncbi:methyltransferase [Bailinhaonella thermotolerans]|uniref:Methyltransferase n=1 Tax=Bailinhaonella thermotolerans TaxID=1070861 RepID=A0A3A4B2C3_9ACTN|nr:methyltransferase [Bailinhaonella thermotolerans]RJL35885.1 methyltransferase [Bailinhaonella thermotolerans]